MPATYRPGDRIPMSWEEYEALSHDDVRGEYVEGVLVVSAAPSEPHQRIAFKLARALTDQLEPGLRVTLGWAWKPATDEFVPDVMVYEPGSSIQRYLGLPVLAVEVLSSDWAADLYRKARKYAEAGLPRYWVVDPAGPEIIEHHLAAGVLVEVARHSGDEPAGLTVADRVVTVVPAELAG